MTYEEFIAKWEKSHPFVKRRGVNGPGFEYDDIEIEIMQKLDWMEHCKQTNQILDESFLDDLYTKILEDFADNAFCGKYVSIGDFERFILNIPDSIDNHKKREHYDDLLLERVVNLLNYDDINEKLPFEYRLKLFLMWIECRNSFLVDVNLGWSSDEAGSLTNFYIRYRDEFIKIRETDFKTMLMIAKYFLALYYSCKTMDRINMAGDIVTVNNRVLDFMRDLLASSQRNGYFDYETEIKNIIKDLIAETSAVPSVFISYTWADEKIVDKIEDGIKDYALVHRDKHELKTGDSLRSFMNIIRDQDYVILVVSDTYLQRKNCMYEVLQLLRDYYEKEKDKFWDKVAIYVTASDVYTAEGKAKKIQYWIDSCEQIEKMISSLPETSKELLVTEAKTLRYISMEIDKLLDHISDSLNEKDLDKFIIEQRTKLAKWAQYGRTPYHDVILAATTTTVN